MYIYAFVAVSCSFRLNYTLLTILTCNSTVSSCILPSVNLRFSIVHLYLPSSFVILHKCLSLLQVSNSFLHLILACLLFNILNLLLKR